MSRDEARKTLDLARAGGKTYRQILCALGVGEIHLFETKAQADTANAHFCKFYDSRRFKRAGLEVTRIA